MSATFACAWCKRETINGVAVGAPLLYQKYQTASHGGCTECVQDFEEGYTNEQIIARSRSRAFGLAVVASTQASSKHGS